MLNFKRSVVPALALVTLAGGLVACGDDSPDTPGTTTAETTPDTPAETTADTPPATTSPSDTTPATTGAADPSTPDETTGSGTGNDGTSPDADLPTEESAEVLVDLSEDDAEEAAEELGWAMRVVRRDGEDLAITMDLRDNRVNVEVADGIVTSIVDIG